jgi:hypothetical protein
MLLLVVYQSEALFVTLKEEHRFIKFSFKGD